MQTKSEIDQLSKSVDAFAGSVRWWNNAYIVLLGLTFLASAIIAFRNNALSREEKKLSDAKDGQIADALKAAGDANERTGKLEKQTEELKQSNIAAQRALEAEKIERLQLEQSVAPRVIVDQEKLAEALKRFAGCSFILRYADREAQFLAGTLSVALGIAGWKSVPEIQPDNSKISSSDGITIENNVEPQAPNDRSIEAGKALREELNKRGFDTNAMPSSDKLPLDTVRIVVGFNFNWYLFMNEINRQLDERHKKHEIAPKP